MADIKDIAEKLINMTAAEVNCLSSEIKTLTNIHDDISRINYIDKIMSPKEYGMYKMKKRKKRWNQKS